MSNEEQTLHPPNAEADEQAASELDFIYTSSIEVFSNLWDLRIVFGDRRPDNRVNRKCAVVMSHRHAKALSQVLTKQIASLERALGDISMTVIIPEGAKEQSETADTKTTKARGHKR